MQELLLSYSEGIVELIIAVVRLFKGLQVMEAEAINQGGEAYGRCCSCVVSRDSLV
jgi:hypothetical protein